MGEQNSRSGSNPAFDRRTYLRGGALTLGLLATPVVGSASAEGRDLPNSISVVSDADERAFYRFAVSDYIEARWQADLTGAESPDGVDGRSAFGSVAEGGADNFHFAGDVVYFSLDGPATVYMNGDELDVEQRWNLPNHLVVESTADERATYEFAVDGDLQPGSVADLENAEVPDSVEGNTGSGAVAEGGTDDFHYSGEIANFSYEGPLALSRNGQSVDPDSFGGGSNEPVEIAVDTVATGLEIPWGAAFLGNTLYLTERPGRIVRIDGGEREVVADLTDSTRANGYGEGGLLGFAVHPEDPNRTYAYQTFVKNGGAANRILELDAANDFSPTVLFDDIEGADGHDGGRLAIDGDALYATVGDTKDPQSAQDPSTLSGAVMRFTLNGEPHPDNPFDDGDGHPAVFTYGHRNPQGLAFRDGQVYSTEHGPDHDDEINILEAGSNYGWPRASGTESEDGSVKAVAAYTPTIAPGSATFYEGPITQWQGDFFFGTLSGEHLHRVRLDGRAVEEQERLYEGEYGRIRTAFTGPDDHLYLATSNRDGRTDSVAETDDRILRLRPK